jgi:hypothetical protein
VGAQQGEGSSLGATRWDRPGIVVEMIITGHSEFYQGRTWRYSNQGQKEGSCTTLDGLVAPSRPVEARREVILPPMLLCTARGRLHEGCVVLRSY